MTSDSTNIRVMKVGAAEWSAFVASSPQRGLFVSPEFLSATGSEATFFLAFRHGRPVAGSIRPAHTSPTVQWFQHHSLILSSEEYGMALRGSFAHTTASTMLLRDVIAGRESGKLSFHPSIVDVRAVNWLFKEHGLQPVWKPRFTGHIDVGSMTVRGRLGRMLRQVPRDTFQVTTTARCRELIEVITAANIPDVVRDLIWIEETASRLLARGMATVLIARDTSDEKTRAAFLVVDWNDTAHVMFGGVCGSSPARRYAGPVLDDFVVRRARQFGLAVVDLMGMEGNSRALYKSGWTTHLVRWLEVCWGQE